MIVEMQNVRESVWNSALREVEPKGTLFQSTYWAEYLRRTFGDRPIYLASLDKKGNIQGQLLAIQSCYGKHAALTLSGKSGLLLSKSYKHIVSPLLHKMAPFIFWENGPIILSKSTMESSSYKMLYRQMLERIVKKAYKLDCYEIKFARPSFFCDDSEIFSSLGFKKRRMGTILDNINCSTETLWQRIHREGRRTINRAIERGIVVHKAHKFQELKEFYSLNVEASRRAKIKIYPFSFFASLWNYFSPLNKIAIFIARLNDSPIGAALFLMHNEIIHLFAIGDSDYARSNRIYPNDALIWHVMKWASERGFKYFDHSGVELYKIDAGDEKARNIYRFKSKWGGHLVEYHDYEKCLQNKKIIRILKPFISDSVIHN